MSLDELFPIPDGFIFTLHPSPLALHPSPFRIFIGAEPALADKNYPEPPNLSVYPHVLKRCGPAAALVHSLITTYCRCNKDANYKPYHYNYAWWCQTSISHIAKELSLSERSVQRALKTLRKHHHIFILRKYKDRSWYRDTMQPIQE